MPKLDMSARDAMNAADSFQRTMNNARRTPPVLPMVQKVSQQNECYIFNVGPWMQQKPMGSLPDFIIEAKPKDAAYAGPYTVPGIVFEPYPIQPDENKLLQYDGWDVAQQIVGAPGTPFSDPRNSLVPSGVFASRNNPPTEEELEVARQALRKKLTDLVKEADDAYSLGPKAFGENISPDLHFTAARILGKTEAECQWLKNTAPAQARAECPGCGGHYKVGVMIHGGADGCGYIFDHAAWTANQKGK